MSTCGIRHYCLKEENDILYNTISFSSSLFLKKK